MVTAQDGKTALEVLDSYKEIKLVLVDFTLKDMDGAILCSRIREKRKREGLAVIGFSPAADGKIGARLIKSGADDVIVRAMFSVEEFYCRVTHCLETVRLFDEIRKGAMTDYLSGLSNRRHFFEAGVELHKSCRKNDHTLACVLVDIDYFKKVNDSHGHDVGDMVIKGLAKILRANAGEKDIVARIGGEEFCLLVPQLEPPALLARVEAMRRTIEKTVMVDLADGRHIAVTSSIGVCTVIGDDVEAMMKIADERLYVAKKSGRNRVIA